jgi:hypothetical protein
MQAIIERFGSACTLFGWTAALAALALLCQVPAASGAAQQLTCSAGAVDGPVSYGDLVTCEINPAPEAQQYRFQGSTGDVVVIQATSFETPTVPSPGQPCLEVLRPDDTTLDAFCSNVSSIKLNPTLDQTGEYRIRVSDYQSNQLVPYNLVLDRVGGPASPGATLLDPGDSLPGEVDPLGEIDFFAFQGEAGDAISLVATDTSGSAAAAIALQLLGPDGVQLDLRANQGNQATISRTLVESGIYSVLIWEYQNNLSMAYNLVYSCTGTCPSLVLTYRYIGTASIEDLGGSVAPEVVALRQNRNTKITSLLIKDGGTKGTIKSVRVFGNTIEPLGLAAIGDQNGDAVSELAVLGASANGAIRVWVVDPDAGTVISSNTFFGSSYSPLGVTRIEDLNGDSRPEVGVTAVNKATNAVILRIKDQASWTTVTSINNLPK